MEFIIFLAIALGIPIVLWAGVAVTMGVNFFYLGTSIWVILCEIISVYLIPAGVLVYRKIQHRNRSWAVIAVVASVVFMVPFALVVRQNILSFPEGRKPYDLWRESIQDSCRFYPRNSPAEAGSVRITDPIWPVYTGESPLVWEKIPGDTAEEWNLAAGYVAIINETFEHTGYEYVDEKTQRELGIRAVKYTWYVSICDLKNKRVVAENTIVGPEPPEKIQGPANAQHERYGIFPKDEYDAWIASLTGQ